ncbi:MAG: HAD-IIA family hydrolase [Brooklawnia sp.]|uniref:HAD-IIA family hydrolase n=1 Tax=Brooklawnia sp. TaxID=2699740 RepID=UPI003C7738F5
MPDLLSAPTRFHSAYIFDMDGTIYLGDHLLPGAARLVTELRDRRIPVRFLSNNPTRDPQMYADMLADLGQPTPVADIANTVVTTTRWLLANHPDAVLFVVGEEPLQRALRDAGFELSDDPARIDIVVASYDRTFEYRKLQIAFDAIWYHKRAFLVQTNPDRFCPFPGGRGEPDCAAITAAIEACTQTTCRASFGKPDPMMARLAIEGLDVSPEEVVMVGDRLQTDMTMARGSGMGTALVLTGEATAADVRALPHDEKPDYVLDRVDRMIPQAVWDELGWRADDA